MIFPTCFALFMLFACEKQVSEIKNEENHTEIDKPDDIPDDIPDANSSMNEAKWVLDFQDDFNGDKLNEDNWGIYDNSWLDEYFPNEDHSEHMRRREAVQVKDGFLNLSVDKHPTDPKRYMTGGVAHKKNYLYGKFEFRVRMDSDPHNSTSGVGLTWPESEKWPADGENDIYETHHTDNNWSSWVHWGKLINNNQWEDQKHHKSYDFDKTKWHVIAMEWEPNVIKFYVNGNLVWKMQDTGSIAKNPHHICFQVEKDLKKGFTKPIKMQVDWVKIYKKQQWKLVFQENFNGSSVNTSEWLMYDSPGHAGNGLRKPEAFSVKNGLLIVTAQMKNNKIVSGGMAHKRNYTFGKFEFKVRTEPDPSQATSGVVLTWPQSEKWPVDGENDIYETGTSSSRNPFKTFIHYDVDNKQHEFVHQADGSQWQIMAMEWTEHSIKIFRDNKLIWTLTDPKAIPKNPHHLCIQLDAFQKTMGNPVKMYVDWVKIYQEK